MSVIIEFVCAFSDHPRGPRLFWTLAMSSGLYMCWAMYEIGYLANRSVRLFLLIRTVSERVIETGLRYGFTVLASEVFGAVAVLKILAIGSSIKSPPHLL